MSFWYDPDYMVAFDHVSILTALFFRHQQIPILWNRAAQSKPTLLNEAEESIETMWTRITNRADF